MRKINPWNSPFSARLGNWLVPAVRIVAYNQFFGNGAPIIPKRSIDIEDFVAIEQITQALKVARIH